MTTDTISNVTTNLLKASDVATKLNISRSLAYQLLLTGEIPTVRFNRTVRVIEADLLKFIQQRRSAEKNY